MSEDARASVPYVFDLRFPWDERECVRAERALVRLRDGHRTVIGIAMGAGGVLALLSVAEVAAEGLAAGGALLAMLLPAAGFFLLGPWIVLRVLPDTMALRNRKPARWSPGQRFAVSDDDLVVELPGGAALVPWNAVSKVVETDEFLFVFRREGLPVYVPKRAFRDAAQLEAARSFVRGHVSPEAKLGWSARPAGLPKPEGGPADTAAPGGAPGAARD